MMTPGLNWGATPAEQKTTMPCDALAPAARTRADRAIHIKAPPARVFAWLCQLRVAPYSYDVLDNFGRRSPRQRDPDLCHLEVGQRFMTVFRLHSFVDDRHITLRAKQVAVTYAVQPHRGGTRLHVRVVFEGPKLLGRLAAAGDLVMMRRQLLTLKSLAEREAVPHARRTTVAANNGEYADAFEIPTPETDDRTPEQVLRAALDRASLLARLVPIAHRHVLRFRLGPASSPDHVMGWRIVSSDPDVIRLRASGPLIRAEIVGRKTGSTAVFTTFVCYVRPTPARIIWALVGPLHRRVAPYLLELGAQPMPSTRRIAQDGAW